MKTNCGHSEGASGICSLAKIITVMEKGVIPGNLHFENPNPNIPALLDGSLEVVTKPTPFPGGHIGLNSFGFGGANVHIILKSNEADHIGAAIREKPHIPRLVLTCGRSEESVEAVLERLSTSNLPDAAYALLNEVGRAPTQMMTRRGFAIVPIEGEATTFQAPAEPEKRPVYFVYAGMGSQWNTMGRQMMEFDVFAKSIRRSHELLKPFGIDLLQILTGDQIENPSMVVPFVSIAAMQVALTDCLLACGVKPDGIVGHSVSSLSRIFPILSEIPEF